MTKAEELKKYYADKEKNQKAKNSELYKTYINHVLYNDGRHYFVNNKQVSYEAYSDVFKIIINSEDELIENIINSINNVVENDKPIIETKTFYFIF